MAASTARTPSIDLEYNLNSSFDGQAKDFDQRTGLPDSACRPIADAVLESVQQRGQTVAHMIEVGAGTGQIGQHFHRQDINYKGIDYSSEMLEVFKSRLDEQSIATGDAFELVHADGRERWPIDSQSIDLVFSSRAIHLFEPQHFSQELCRVASSAGLMLVAGRRKRDKSSVPAIMRSQMRSFLGEQGIKGRNGQNPVKNLIEPLEQMAELKQLDSITVTSWTTQRSPLDSIQSWREKEGLAGLQVEVETKRMILKQLESWATEQFGDISTKSTVNESYVLELLKIRPVKQG